MEWIKGIPVILHQRIRTGSDPFGVGIYEDQAVTVDNVLVSPASSSDVEDSTKLYGKHAVYSLGIPKGDSHQWEDSIVEFFGRKWRTFGVLQLGIEADVPTAWHGKIQVEVYEC